MSLNTNYPVVNPRLGASFAIFTSAFISLVLMLMILEQLGLARATIGQLIIVMPVLFYMAIGVFVRTISVEDFFISGQRVPALYNGLSLSANCTGGVVVLAFTGAFLFGGVDLFAIGIGVCAGLALMLILFAGAMRKTGAYTLPGFFALRFNSRLVRLAAAVFVIPPALLLFAAELKLGAAVAAFFVPLPQTTLAMIGAAAIVATIALGGMRSLTWSQCGQVIVLLFGLAIPIIAVSVMLTNLPLPQFTYGQVLRDVAQLEISKSLLQGASGPQGLSDALQASDYQAFTRPIARIFGTLSPVDFTLLILCVMIGTAVLPTQMARLSTTPNVPAVRKSLGWAVLFTGVLVITLPAFAVFVKYYVASGLSGQSVSELPFWSRMAQSMNLIRVTGDALAPAAGEGVVLLKRDVAMLLLPLAAELPYVFFGVVATAAIAAVLAAAGGQILSIANVMSNDIYHALLSRGATPSRRLFVARLSIVLAATAGLVLAMDSPHNPVTLALWAISLTGATFFPALLISIWSARASTIAVLSGMAAGFCATAAYIVMTEGGEPTWFGIDNLIAGIIGAPVAAAVTIVLSILSPRASEEAREFIEEIRLSGSETIHARSLRLAARGKIPKP